MELPGVNIKSAATGNSLFVSVLVIRCDELRTERMVLYVSIIGEYIFPGICPIVIVGFLSERTLGIRRLIGCSLSSPVLS